MSKQPEAIPAVKWKPTRAHHPEAAKSSTLMDTINIALKTNYVKHKFSGWMTGFEPATTRSTIWDSTTELHPPYALSIWNNRGFLSITRNGILYVRVLQ